jgi:hypothetical protein
MAYLLADRRSRLYVAGSSQGVRTFTHDARQAKAFRDVAAAERWLFDHITTVELTANVLVSRRSALTRNENPAQGGNPGRANSQSPSRTSDRGNSEFSDSDPQARH